MIQKVSQARLLHLAQAHNLFLNQSQLRTQDAVLVPNPYQKVFQTVYLVHSLIHHVNPTLTPHLNLAQHHFLSL